MTRINYPKILIQLTTGFLFILSTFHLNGQVVSLSKQDTVYLDSLYTLFFKSITKKYQEAERIGRKIEQYALKKEYNEKVFEVRADISMVYFLQRKNKELFNFVDTTKQLLKDLNISTSSFHYANLFYLYGKAYEGFGRFKSALFFFEETVNHPNFQDFFFRKDDLFENIAKMNSQQGDYQKSERYFHQAIKHIDLNGSITKRDIANRYNRMGKNYELWNKPDKALAYYQLALQQIAPNTKDSLEIEQLVSLYTRLSKYHIKYKESDKSLGYLKKAHQLIASNEQLLDYTKALAFLKKQEGLVEESLQVFSEALALSKKIYGKTHTNHGEIYLKIGTLYASTNKHHKALEYYEQSLNNIIWNYDKDSTTLSSSRIAELSAPLAYFQLLQLKAISLTEIGNLSKALEAYQFAAAFIDLQCNYYLATEESRLFWIAKAKPLYEKAIEIALKLNQKEVVFDFIQRGHGLLLLQNMQQAEAIFNASLPDSLKKQELSYKISRSALDSRLLAAKKANNQDSIRVLEIQKSALNTDYEQFIGSIKKQYPRYAQAVSTFPHKSIETIRQEILTNKNALIEYFIGEKAIYSMVLTQKDLQIFKTHKNGNFINQINTFRLLIQKYNYSLPAYTQFCKTGFELYETLLKPTLVQLPLSINELIIIPDEQLNYIPFAAILDAPVDVSDEIINYTELPYLLNKYAISYNYANSLFGKLKNEGNPNDVVGFAPSFGGAYSPNRNLDSLIYNTEEIQIIDSIIDGQMYLRDAATLTVFKEKIPHSNIVHLATHATVNDTLPMDSYIYFYKDSLPIHEIPTLRHNLNLAVLSACETGKGMLKKGEGILSLARAFIQSGCPSVITSLWKVNDPKTPTLMEYFYIALKSGKKKNIALAIAQKNYIQKKYMGNSYSHPFYWATFIQVGDTSPLFQEEKCWTILFASILLGICLIFLIWKFISKQRF